MMFAIKLNVHGPTGDRHVYDYFADWFSEWKLKHFCDTTGQGAAYEKGNVDGTNGAFIGKTGYVTIAIEKGKGSFGDKNVVKDYVPKEAKLAAPEVPEEDDSIPF